MIDFLYIFLKPIRWSNEYFMLMCEQGNEKKNKYCSRGVGLVRSFCPVQWAQPFKASIPHCVGWIFTLIMVGQWPKGSKRRITTIIIISPFSGLLKLSCNLDSLQSALVCVSECVSLILKCRIALITRDLAINNNQFSIRMAHVRLAAVAIVVTVPAFVCYRIINATYIKLSIRLRIYLTWSNNAHTAHTQRHKLTNGTMITRNKLYARIVQKSYQNGFIEQWSDGAVQLWLQLQLQLHAFIHICGRLKCRTLFKNNCVEKS